MVAWTIAGVLAALLLVVAVRARRRAPPSVVVEAPPVERSPSGATAFTAVPVIGLIVDRESRIVEANVFARERFPFLRSGMSVLEAFSQHLLANPVAAAIALGRSHRSTVRLFSDGWRTYGAEVTPDPGGAGAIVFLIDHTDETSYQELRSQFLANVSHELRTPLTGVSAILETLGDQSLDAEARARFLARAQHETGRLTALLSDTLFLAELEAMEGTPINERTDLTLAADEVVQGLSDQALAGGLRLEMSAPGPCVVGLSDQLAHTVVLNLVENAIRYAGVGAQVIVRLSHEGDEVELSVGDDGVGIAERHLPHVFERFYRVDVSRSRQVGGTGLGLSIVKHIVERAGGHAEVDSRAGRGTTFRIVFPRAPGGSLD